MIGIDLDQGAGAVSSQDDTARVGGYLVPEALQVLLPSKVPEYQTH